MQDLTALACGDFLSALAGPAAAPGGGGVSALAGALGVALGNMVGSLTVGKPKYAAVEPEIRALNSQAESLRCQLEVLIQADAEAFAPVAAAYRMPRATPEQAAEKAAALEAALAGACAVPMKVMELVFFLPLLWLWFRLAKVNLLPSRNLAAPNDFHNIIRRTN